MKKADDFVSEKKVAFKKQIINLEGLIEAYFNAVQTDFEEKLKVHV